MIFSLHRELGGATADTEEPGMTIEYYNPIVPRV